MAWIYLFVAALMEVCWIFSLKFFQMNKIFNRDFLGILFTAEGLLILMPFLGYIGFGLGNIYLFSLSMKTIPASTAFAVWTAIATIGSKGVDVLFFNASFSLYQGLSLLAILAGVAGMKYFE